MQKTGGKAQIEMGRWSGRREEIPLGEYLKKKLRRLRLQFDVTKYSIALK